MAREGLRERGISEEEYTERLRRVEAAVSELVLPMREARKTADKTFSRWRRAVVQHLFH